MDYSKIREQFASRPDAHGALIAQSGPTRIAFSDGASVVGEVMDAMPDDFDIAEGCATYRPDYVFGEAFGGFAVTEVWLIGEPDETGAFDVARREFPEPISIDLDRQEVFDFGMLFWA